MNDNITIARRLRELLERKRDTLRHYLSVLEQQETAIEAEDTSRLEHQVALETEVLKELSVVQRVITPLRDLGIAPESGAPLEASLERLQAEISSRQRKNRELLSAQMADLSARIERVDVPPRPNEVYRASEQQPALIDITL